MTLVGLNTDQAVAKGRARKGAKGGAPSGFSWGITNPGSRKAGKGAAERTSLRRPTRKTRVCMEDALATQ
jgi:hypothetical protein